MLPQILFRGLLIAVTIGIGTNLAFGEIKVLSVEPSETDPAIATVHGPSIAMYDSDGTSRHRLFLFIVGTGGKATDSRSVDRAFASWGYHAISLDYEDNVIAVSCAHSPDPTSFGRYREAIVTGAPMSKTVKVSPANSILNRFRKLLVYLVSNDPKGDWDQFVTNGEPVWSRVVVAGHSQGSGHAAYIGKMFKVDRVLMFSGPQDYMEDLHRPAPWQARKSATPPSRFYAFLHRKDPFNVDHQIANCMMLMGLSKRDTAMVNPGVLIHSSSHILINNIETRDPHGSTILPEFKNVWKYMATDSEE